MSKTLKIKVNHAMQEFCSNTQTSIAAFLNTRTNNNSGTPVAWFTIAQNNIIQDNPIQVTYAKSYNVYDSLVNEHVPQNGVVTVGKVLSAKIGDGFDIIDKQLEAGETGGSTNIRLTNKTSGPSIVGGLAGDDGTPICAFDCYNGVNIFMEPVDKITIAFVGKPYQVGTAIVSTTQPSVVVDMTNISNGQTVEIEYDTENGKWIMVTGSSPTAPLQAIPGSSKLQPFTLPADL